MMIGWKEYPRNAAAMPYFIWGLFALIPGNTATCTCIPEYVVIALKSSEEIKFGGLVVNHLCKVIS